MLNAIHVTHEAVSKVGGIGTVLEGLINSRPYRDGIGRSVLVCPLFSPEDKERLGPGATLEYSALDNVYGGPYAAALRQVERDWNVRLAYGRRPVEDVPSARQTVCEVLLVDLRGIQRSRLNGLKGMLYEHYGLRSDLYEHLWEYEQYVQLAGPAAAALEALRLGTAEAPAIVFAHEFMGVATALTLQCLFAERYRTLFYAHEVASVRRIVERHPGHDVMFYNVLRAAADNRLTMEQVFGPQSDFHKHALIEAARHCDGVLAVGHHVGDELRFVHPGYEHADIALCFNGVPASHVTLEQRHAAGARLRQYVQNLLGWRPDHVFTHVTRLAPSKAMWRDIDVLSALDPHLAAAGRTAVLLVLATELPQRPFADIVKMEQSWDWPVAHREGGPDLTAREASYYQWVQAFNTRARAIRIIYINQFGFDRDRCGWRVPPELEFLDLRQASELEFGLSLYEPFGISPLEPLTYGGLCLVSTTCGCTGFLRQVSGQRRPPNVLLANYIDLLRRPRTVKDALALGAAERREIETRLGEQLADQLMKRLPAGPDEEQKLLESGYELAHKMSWDAVAERFVFPAIRRACTRRRVRVVA